MVFTAEPMQATNEPKIKRAEFPFQAMKDNPEPSGFVIPAANNDLFAYARVQASKFNQANKTFITCNKQRDGSLKVWNNIPPLSDTVQLLKASVNIAEQRKEQKQAANEQQPTKQQFIEWITGSLKPGMSYTFQFEYAHRFDEFKLWASEISNCETEIKFNPPSLKISRKVT